MFVVVVVVCDTNPERCYRYHFKRRGSSWRFCRGVSSNAAPSTANPKEPARSRTAAAARIFIGIRICEWRSGRAKGIGRARAPRGREERWRDLGYASKSFDPPPQRRREWRGRWRQSPRRRRRRRRHATSRVMGDRSNDDGVEVNFGRFLDHVAFLDGDRGDTEARRYFGATAAEGASRCSRTASNAFQVGPRVDVTRRECKDSRSVSTVRRVADIAAAHDLVDDDGRERRTRASSSRVAARLGELVRQRHRRSGLATTTTGRLVE